MWSIIYRRQIAFGRIHKCCSCMMYNRCWVVNSMWSCCSMTQCCMVGSQGMVRRMLRTMVHYSCMMRSSMDGRMMCCMHRVVWIMDWVMWQCMMKRSCSCMMCHSMVCCRRRRW